MDAIGCCKPAFLPAQGDHSRRDGATAADAPTVPITDEILTTEVDWVRAVLSSLYTAGLTVAPVDELPTGTEG